MPTKSSTNKTFHVIEKGQTFVEPKEISIRLDSVGAATSYAGLQDKAKQIIKAPKRIQQKLKVSRTISVTDNRTLRNIREITKWCKSKTSELSKKTKTVSDYVRLAKRKSTAALNTSEFRSYVLNASLRLQSSLNCQRLGQQLFREIVYFYLALEIFSYFSEFNAFAEMHEAFVERDWKKVFYMLEHFMRIPIIMLYLSTLTSNSSAGVYTLAFLLPFYILLKHRLPAKGIPIVGGSLNWLLDWLFFKIFTQNHKSKNA